MGPTGQRQPCASADLHRQTWVCGSVAGFLASGPDRVARNEMVDARARVLCSPSLRGGPRLADWVRTMTVESGHSPARHVRPGWTGRSAITKAPGSPTAKCFGYTACV